ncbi:MAG TPA: hypothetical protein VFG12_17555, partial [Rhodopila sp.]|nr:hypothetical protein [Rhodopila sp.]
MMDASWLPVLAKAVSTALVVVIASSLAEALGPFWGGLIASLPVSTGPAYVFLAMQHDAAFVAASALSSCATNAATGLFLVVYAKAAGRRPPWVSLGTALATWLAASLVIRQATWTPATVVALNLVVYGAGFLLLSSRRINHPADRRTSATQDAPQTPSPTRRRWSDIPTRALAVAAFVSAVVIASTALGPQATGIATVFPISLTSLIVIVRPRIGGPASAHL